MRTTRPWIDALVWLAYALSGIFLPIIASIILLLALQLELTLGGFTNGGQFALYSAAMWTTASYLIARPAFSRLRFTEVLVLVTFAGLFLSAVFFVIAAVAANGGRINQMVIQWPTVGLFMFSTASAFLVVGLDKRRAEVDILGHRQAAEKALNEAFDKGERN